MGGVEIITIHITRYMIHITRYIFVYRVPCILYRIHMILFLYGKDTFRSRQQMKKMVEKFKADRDPQGYNIVTIDAAAERNSSRILNEIFTVPFLAERRMVVLESFLSTKHHTPVFSEFLDRIEKNTFP